MPKLSVTDRADFEWEAFYRGHPVQRWWKQGIAKVVWEMVPSSDSLLEIGSGSSPIVSHYPKAVVVDLNEDKLRFLKGKLPSLTIRVMSACKLDFPKESFEHVLCLEVLEHLPSPKACVEEVARVLKLKGRAVFATPDYNRWHWYLAERFTAYKDGHIHKFNRKDLEMLCARHRLMPVRYQYVAAADLVELFEKR
jgi:ubiquinone/menaquinone biosynthesis C-methylase UbiE